MNAEALASSRTKYQLYEFACSQKTKWPQDKKLDHHFSEAYFKDVLLDPKNHFTMVAVGAQPITDARKDCTTMGVAPGSGKDSVQRLMNSKVRVCVI